MFDGMEKDAGSETRFSVRLEALLRRWMLPVTTGGLDEQRARFGWNFQMKRQQFSDLTRGTSFIAFDLSDGGERTTNSLSEHLLREIEPSAALFDPGSERVNMHWREF